MWLAYLVGVFISFFIMLHWVARPSHYEDDIEDAMLAIGCSVLWPLALPVVLTSSLVKFIRNKRRVG